MIVMTDGPKGATGGDESHNTKRPMERALENEEHIHPVEPAFPVPAGQATPN